jgi:plastocyanin
MLFLAAAVGTVLAFILASAVVAESPAASGTLATGAAPAASGPTATSPAPAASGPTASLGPDGIAIVQKTFQPSTLTVNLGDTVTWTVTQSIGEPHSVTSGTPNDATTGKVFDSGIKLKNDGDSFSWQFTAPGTYPFFCQVHPDTMTGTITVLDASGTVPGSEGPISSSSKLIAAVILIAVILLFFGWARIYRRMNPGP